ncbi:MAG: CRISPR-associated protein (Cas_Csd1) [Syntrophorhabdaceae bacterium PtaU1.Bin034]|nr:MAG: CRISPR-associated protein (Cas_Csd1) [Syntrophorhabdaceae bacterium PtaU1.Bin034]
MFRALVELGRDLEARGKLPSPGFYYYKEPIKWVVHLWPDRIYLESTESEYPRPFSGRTSGIQPHLLVDEAGYALAVARNKGGTDKHAAEKHESFRSLVKDFLRYDGLSDPDLREAVRWLETALGEGRAREGSRFDEVLSKDWVSFVPEAGPLRGRHLFEHPEAKAFWLKELKNRSSPGEKKEKRQVRGECAVCGKEGLLVGRIPVGVKLVGNTPLHSINADAFTSFMSGSGAFKRGHIGLCFECGDTASRAFNYLSDSPQHRRDLVRDSAKRDSLSNQIALFWLKAPSPISVGDRVLDLTEMISNFGTVLSERRNDGNGAPPATTSQLLALLELPWKPTEAALRLDDFAFYLAVVSPNVGRIALREWIEVSLGDLKERLRKFLEGAKIVAYDGTSVFPASIGGMLDALGSKNPNLTRALLRTAYTGFYPPGELHVTAAQRLGGLFPNEDALRERNRKSRERLWDDRWPQALAAAIKLGLYYDSEEGERMTELNEECGNPAYLCGCLLAVLEEAQQIATYVKARRRLETTIVNRFYGGASSAPKSTFGKLMSLAAVAHLPDAGKDINVRLECIATALQKADGFPKTLNLEEQADFALGFYHQRAKFRFDRNSEKPEGGAK